MKYYLSPGVRPSTYSVGICPLLCAELVNEKYPPCRRYVGLSVKMVRFLLTATGN